MKRKKGTRGAGRKPRELGTLADVRAVLPNVFIGPGRPTLYSPAVVDKICAGLEQGLTLRKVCTDDPALPAKTTVTDWMRDKPEVMARISKARQLGAFAMVDDAQERAVNVRLKDEVPAARLAAEVLLKIAGYHNQAAFGDRKLVQQSIDMNVRHDLGGLTREQREALLNLLGGVIDATPEERGTQ